jgi:NAD(P)-dependent dehydrogenase (short-subunit alcohol dehydrogenase family)
MSVGLLDGFDLSDRVAVVTGSGQGIGRAIAWGLADAGCNPVLNARRVTDRRGTAVGRGERGRQALIVDGHIREGSETVAERSMDQFGRIDIWVNNVGGSDERTTRALINTPDEIFPSQLDSIASTIPLETLGTPDDIAGAVLYLASDVASWVTGQLILVAGGRTHRTHTYKPRTV